MPRLNAEVRWFGREATVEINRRVDRIADRAAFQILGTARVNLTNNGQVDTGFLRASGYVKSSQHNTYAEIDDDGEYVSRKHGNLVSRDAAPEAPLDRDALALVGFAAEYAMYPEADMPWLFPAIEEVAGQIGGIVREVASD